jgi:hypothetical protein
LITSSISDRSHSLHKKIVDVGVQTKLSNNDFNNALNNLRRDKKILQQKLNRKDKRVSNIQDILRLLKDNNLIKKIVESILKNQFQSSLPFTLFSNETSNSQNLETCRSYSEEIRKFRLTLHFYSLCAYDFIRQRSTLPDPSTIRRFLASRNCNPGILYEVIEYFKLK